MPPNPPDLSIVVPVAPGEQAWPGLLSRLDEAGAMDGCDEACEIVLAAAEPAPPSLPAAVRWIEGPFGRAAQLNRGACAARGAALWFLHADSRPDPEAIVAARTWPVQESRLAWFDLAFGDDGPPAVRLNAAGANFRSRWLGLPFGDQGLLCSRMLFDELGGFDEDFGLGEDLDFVVRARRSGARLQRLPGTVVTSARRYRRHGWLSTSARHAWLTMRLWLRSRRRAAE
ncbi:MAG: hypothetical protein R3323_01350 [Wenzhouxiangellaceae bacterium]|nr:hypothetical protein [Wenzhouxiangellaceae bacterium]